MCDNKREEEQAIRSFQEQFLLQQHQQQQGGGDFFAAAAGQYRLPEISPIMLPTWKVNSFHQTHFATAGAGSAHHQHDPFASPPPHPPPSNYNYCGLFGAGRRPPPAGLQFAYDGTSSSDHLRILSETLGPVVGPGSGKMTAQEIMDAKAIAASKSHSEAERRRRERINNHLAKLRSLLPSTTKTDKASLLAEVIQHVKELKRQTSLIAETTPIPTETDELTVVDAADDVDGKFVIKASLCCDDRSDLLPDLIKTLKALRLKTLKAEITTLGGRVKNVLFFTGDDQEDNGDGEDDGGQQMPPPPLPPQYCISSIQEALKAVMEKSSSGEDTSANAKRQRTTNISVIDHRSL